MADKRADIYVKEYMNISRQKARELIENGAVSINGKVVLKPAAVVSDSDNVEVKNADAVLKYAGRGGYKLEKALNAFSISVEGICIDIGASTGGFTDCMLQKGAEKVYAVDVGNNQLADKLKDDSRVVSMENTDIRKADIEKADFISCDVSFISLTKIFEKVSELLNDDGCFVFLIKPQFEAGRENIGKNGIVKNSKVHRKVIKNITECASEKGLFVNALTYSPIRGGDGNIEYLASAYKKETDVIKQQYIDSVVESAFENFKNR